MRQHGGNRTRYLAGFVLPAFLALGLILAPAAASAQAVPSASKPVCAYCGAALPGGVHSASCPYSGGGAKKPGGHKSPGRAGSADMKAMIVGSIFESLLSSMLFDPQEDEADAARKQAAALEAQQQAAALAERQSEARKAQEAAAQADYERMMQSYKRLDGAGGGTPGGLGLKSLDGDMETLAANARQPFDSPMGLKTPGAAPVAAPTPFFGDAMAEADLQTLANPDSDPRVVDLRKAKDYVVQSLKREAAQPVPPRKAAEERKTRTPDCDRLAHKLDGFLTQRQQFQKTIDLAQEQLDTWREANRNALLNAAKDGFEYVAGQYLDALSRRGAAAERMRAALERNAGQMARDGVDVAAVSARIEALKRTSLVGQTAELANNLNDWSTLAKDGLSGLIAQLSDSDQDVRAMLNDPVLQKYFTTEAPELNTLLDLSKLAAANKVLGKWVARKVPLIAGLELAVKQSYNGLDWLLSFNRIVEANQVNGKVLEAAQGIQRNIDATYASLKACP